MKLRDIIAALLFGLAAVILVVAAAVQPVRGHLVCLAGSCAALALAVLAWP